MGLITIPAQLSEFCQLCLSSTSFLIWASYRNFKDPNWIEKSFSGEVSQSTLKKFIKKSSINQLFNSLLIPVIEQVDEKSINEEIFYILLNYRFLKTRRQLIVVLSHKNLSTDMIIALCGTDMCFEPYFECILRMYQDNSYSTEQLSAAIDLFLKSPFRELKPDLLTEIKIIEASKEKRIIIEKTLAN